MIGEKRIVGELIRVLWIGDGVGFWWVGLEDIRYSSVWKDERRKCRTFYRCVLMYL